MFILLYNIFNPGNIVILGAENHCSLTVGRIKSVIVTSSAPKLFVKKFVWFYLRIFNLFYSMHFQGN